MATPIQNDPPWLTLGFLSCSLHGILSPRIQQDKLAAGKKQLVAGDLVVWMKFRFSVRVECPEPIHDVVCVDHDTVGQIHIYSWF